MAWGENGIARLALHKVGFVIHGGEQVATQDSQERAKRTASGQCPHLEA